MAELSGTEIARELREIAESLARAAAGLSRLADRLDESRPPRPAPDHGSEPDPGTRSAASRVRERSKDDAHEKR